MFLYKVFESLGSVTASEEDGKGVHKTKPFILMFFEAFTSLSITMPQPSYDK